MIRISEMVLAGHPDKFCDQIADAVIAEAMKVDRDAYGQVEVSTWSDEVWLSGGICTRRPMQKTIKDIVFETGRIIGYTEDNCIDAENYKVTDTVCRLVDEPRIWTDKVNDQSVIIGWAGYDAGIRYLPPEHFLAHLLREALTQSCLGGCLGGQGPDGKLMVRMKEQSSGWEVEHILVTLQQKESSAFVDVCAAVEKTVAEAYEKLRNANRRWATPWKDIQLMINPNGPLINGGSDGDNGQTGRKLVMDYYGPRVPIGGGALSGKHLSHIDRIGAYAARDAAVRAVQSGARECLVRVVYAPNIMGPLDVSYEMVGRGHREPKSFFEHSGMIAHYTGVAITRDMARGRHFFDEKLIWNGALLEHGHQKCA
jgi:S-adenosylmethionine synthetase